MPVPMATKNGQEDYDQADFQLIIIIIIIVYLHPIKHWLIDFNGISTCLGVLYLEVRESY